MRTSVFSTIVLALVLSCSIFAAEPLDPAKAKQEKNAHWYDAKLLTIEGQGWSGDSLKAPYDRLPAKAEGKVREPVWGLSRDSAGICVRFATDSSIIRCRWKLTKPQLAMPHMAATGVSGVDLYVKTDAGWRWLGTGKPNNSTNDVVVVNGLSRQLREYCLYLPLYNGVSSVEIGIGGESNISPLPREGQHSKPIVIWGTSITQGACASRPGMTHVAILGRSLDVPVINLGFSGNGMMEPEVAELIGEIDAAVYVMDCLPNCTAAQVSERTAPLVAIWRKSHPITPIVLVEDRTYGDAHLVAERRQRNDASWAALRAEYDKLVKAGDQHLYYIDGETLLGRDGEDTVDGSHPTDLGFVHQAQAMEKVLRPLRASNPLRVE